MTTIELPAEYHEVFIDLDKPETIPWADCQACEIRKLGIGLICNPPYSIMSSRRPRPEGFFTDLEEHFWAQHKIQLRLNKTSPLLGQLRPIHGPFTRTYWAVRYLIIAPDSPYRGRVDYHQCLDRRHAEASTTIYTERPEWFAHVEVVSRTITTTEWTPSP